MNLFLLLVVLPASALLTATADAFPRPQSVLLGSLLMQVVVVVATIASREAPGSVGGHWLPGLVLIRGGVSTLLGDGLPIVIGRVPAVLAALLFGGIIVGECPLDAPHPPRSPSVYSAHTHCTHTLA